MSGPLAGIKVLEMGQLLAGPFAGCMLAYFGAEVIKVEAPGSGDPLRRWREMRDGTSLWWAALARNKRSVTLDLRSAEGQQLARRLATRADVVIENFRPGTLEKWGLDFDAIARENAGLVMARISGYGQTGPLRERPGFASVCEGFGGLRYLNGVPGEPPVRPNLSIGDTLAALHAVIGILLALTHRLRGGDGQYVDVAIYEAVFNMLESVVPEFDGAGLVREPSGSTITGIVPTNTYPCADGSHVIIGGNNDSIFRRLMLAIERPDLADDPRLADNPGRVAHQAEVDAAIAEWTAARTASAALEALGAAAVPSGPIYSVREMFEDPQYAARGLFEQVTVGGRPLRIPAIAPRLSATPGKTNWPGPALGEHTAEVLADILGLDAAAIADLAARGVV